MAAIGGCCLRPAEDGRIAIRHFGAGNRFRMDLGRPFGSPNRCNLILSGRSAFEGKAGTNPGDSGDDHRRHDVERAARPDFLISGIGNMGRFRAGLRVRPLLLSILRIVRRIFRLGQVVRMLARAKQARLDRRRNRPR